MVRSSLAMAVTHKIGPELGFGWVVGDAFEEPVLLIKLAWGEKFGRRLPTKPRR